MKKSKIQYTVRDVPHRLDARLRETAAEYGVSLNEASLVALKKGTGLTDDPALHHDLDDLAGTWVRDPESERALEEMRQAGVDRIVFFPLFPQYSSAAWGSAVEKIYADLSGRWNVPTVSVVPPFYDEPGYLQAFAAVSRPIIDEMQPDLVLMSFHGLPERHCTKSDDSGRHCFATPDCCAAIVQANRNCYRAQCFASARGIAAELGLDELAKRLEENPPKELIIATNPTVEGEATAYYLQQMARKHDIASPIHA